MKLIFLHAQKSRDVAPCGKHHENGRQYSFCRWRSGGKRKIADYFIGHSTSDHTRCRYRHRSNTLNLHVKKGVASQTGNSEKTSMTTSKGIGGKQGCYPVQQQAWHILAIGKKREQAKGCATLSSHNAEQQERVHS